MPYIVAHDRPMFENAILELGDLFSFGRSPGELNYVVTRLAHRFLGPTPRYEDFNTVIGVLEAAKLELYRRMVAPYEDTKIAQNGDVA